MGSTRGEEGGTGSQHIATPRHHTGPPANQLQPARPRSAGGADEQRAAHPMAKLAPWSPEKVPRKNAVHSAIITTTRARKILQAHQGSRYIMVGSRCTPRLELRSATRV